MTRSSIKELFTPFKDPEREFRSSRKHFKTLSLDKSSSPDFNLFSNQEEYSEEEVAETMAETIEQYMSKTRANYGSGIARPKIEDKDSFEIKGQFLKELCDNTFSGSDHEMRTNILRNHWLRNKPSGSITTWEDLKTKFLSKYCPQAFTANKMKEIKNFQQESYENLYQAWERFKELLMKCPQHYLTEMQEVFLFYNGLNVPTRQIFYSRGAIPSKTTDDAKVAIQEMAEYSQKWHNRTLRTISTETSDGSATIQAQLNNLGREIKKLNEKVYDAQVGCEQCKGPHYTKDYPLKKEEKTLKEAYYTQFGAPFQRGGYRATALGFYQRNNVNPSYQERRQSMEDTLSKFMTYSEASHINNFIPRKEKDLGSFTLPCFINNVCFDNALADLGASVSVMPLSTYLNLGLGKLAHTKLTVELVDRIVKYPKGIAKNVLVGIGKFVFPIDFIILDMPEDIKVPLILGRPFLSTARAKIDVFKRKITSRVEEEKIIFKSVKPASSLIKRVYMLSLRKKMELDLEARLMGETLVLNRSLDPFFEDYIELNDLNVPLELRRDQVDDLMPTIKEGEVIEEFRARNDARMVSKVFGYPILEDMDAYRDERMGDVIFGEPFFREVGINTRRFNEMITIYNGNDKVTYQMVRSHPRFKHHINEQCNKIPPLLKDLVAKKSTMLVENQRSGNFEVLES
ncbi:putative reverse transcriptase domain-containing protein [Tanacetum coccineum]